MTEATRDDKATGRNTGGPLVHAVNVLKSFDGTQVLKGIDLDVHKGQVVCLLGPSGSGKTTFLRCINQLETIDGGRIWVDGDLMGYAERGGKLHRLTSKAVAAQRREIGMVFQRFNLFPHMTAVENIMEAPCQVKGEDKATCRDRALALLERVGLAELVGEVLDVMKQLAIEGTTMIVVTHEMSFAREVADHVVFMDGGVVVEEGDPRSVINNPQNDRTKSFLRRMQSEPQAVEHVPATLQDAIVAETKQDPTEGE